MKIFWSWQSDTHGKTGRHFVRECLVDAIAIVNEPADVDEPSEQERRDPIELDQDRVGIVGHPSLADAIFKKIAVAAVFVGDVTLVAELKVDPTEDNPEGIKRLINSNVAIEYGYAVGKLTDDATLLAMNLHYGPLTKLPFDLGHKVAPCRYRLAPDASAADIAKVKKTLTGQFVDALRLHVARVTPPVQVVQFHPMPSTTKPAFFWKPGDLLARIGGAHPFHHDQDDTIEYRFNEEKVFYLRVMPTAALSAQLDITRLTDIVDHQQLDVMTRTFGHKIASRNQYGAIAFEPHGTATTPVAMSQLFRNGEIWGVSREFVAQYQNLPVVAMVNIQNSLAKGLKNYIQVARDELGIDPPYNIEIGAIGLKDVSLSLPPPVSPYTNQTSPPIFDEQLIYSQTLTAITPAAQHALIQEFIRRLYDLANVAYQASVIA